MIELHSYKQRRKARLKLEIVNYIIKAREGTALDVYASLWKEKVLRYSENFRLIRQLLVELVREGIITPHSMPYVYISSGQKVKGKMNVYEVRHE